MIFRLKLFLFILCILFDINLYLKVIKKKLDFKLGLSWFLITVVLILSIIFDNWLMVLKDFLGFEKLSNMVFLFGFICLSLMVLSLSMKISIQNEKIIKLTQEIALIKKSGDKSEKN